MDSKKNTVDLIVTLVVALVFFSLGAKRIGSAYIYYSAEGSIASFLWVQFCGLLLAFGATGIFVVAYRLLIGFLKPGDQN